MSSALLLFRIEVVWKRFLIYKTWGNTLLSNVWIQRKRNTMRQHGRKVETVQIASVDMSPPTQAANGVAVMVQTGKVIFFCP